MAYLARTADLATVRQVIAAVPPSIQPISEALLTSPSLDMHLVGNLHHSPTNPCFYYRITRWRTGVGTGLAGTPAHKRSPKRSPSAGACPPRPPR